MPSSNLNEELVVTKPVAQPALSDADFKNKSSLKIPYKKLVVVFFGLVVIGAGVWAAALNTNLGNNYKLYNFFKKGVSYTLNPALRATPLQSVVKISVGEGENEVYGSGLLFSKGGYIITNAHVVTTELGKKVKKMKVCYTTEDSQETKCTYSAELIDADRYEDLAVIKATENVSEVPYYPLVVSADDESAIKKIVPLGEEIKAVGYPGVGGTSITLTKGVVSGYQNGEIYFNDGSLQHVPYYLKTDTEINHGNSGGAVFDKDNRYIGVATMFHKDAGGKISDVIYWNKINLYLHGLLQRGLLTLPAEQYQKRKFVKDEDHLWSGVDAYFSEDYTGAIADLEVVVEQRPTDSRAWHYLCASYSKDQQFGRLVECADSLLTVNKDAGVLGTYYKARAYDSGKKDYKEALKIIKEFTNKNKVEALDLMLFEARMDIDLKEYKAAEDMFKKMEKIAPENADIPYFRGIALKNQKYWEEAAEYFEDSFYLRPEADVALKLGDTYFDLYHESSYKDDLMQSIIYTLSSAIMEHGNLLTLGKLAGNVAEYVDTDAKNTWGYTVDTLKKRFEKWGLDSELIASIRDLTDDDIRYSWKYDFKYLTQPTKEEIKAERQVAYMIAAWLDTFVGQGGSCIASFKLANAVPLVDTLWALRYSDKDTGVILKRNATLGCLCELKDPMNAEMTKCIDSKLK